MIDTPPLRDEALVVFARYPRPGFVKRRLAAAIGDTAAADLCRAFLTDLRRRVADHASWTTYWAFEPAESPFAEEIGRVDRCFPQQGRSLGVRMEAAMGHALRSGHTSVVLIGSDIPHVPLDVLVEAFHSLARARSSSWDRQKTAGTICRCALRAASLQGDTLERAPTS